MHAHPTTQANPITTQANPMTQANLMTEPHTHSAKAGPPAPESVPDNERGWDFEAATLPHLDALYNMAYRLTRNPDDAEDLIQETFFKAYKYYDKFEEGTNLKAWLFRIMKNSFINGYRKRQNQPPESAFSEIEESFETLVAVDGVAHIKNPEEQFLENVLDEDVQQAIDSLREDYRLVILLVDLEGFSYKEAAEILEVPVGTVMSRLYRGRRILEKTLLDYAHDHGYFTGEPQKMRSQAADTEDLPIVPLRGNPATGA